MSKTLSIILVRTVIGEHGFYLQLSMAFLILNPRTCRPTYPSHQCCLLTEQDRVCLEKLSRTHISCRAYTHKERKRTELGYTWPVSPFELETLIRFLTSLLPPGRVNEEAERERWGVSPYEDSSMRENAQESGKTFPGNTS